MRDPYQKIKALFFEYIPPELIEDLMRLTAAEYRTAYDECKMFYPLEEAHDLRPHVRRAKIESKAREIANSYSGISATVEPNINNTAYHTLIRSGPVLLTINHVNQPSEMVRSALFRDTLARDAQLSFLTPYKPPAADAPLFAILRHGSSKRTPRRPDFMLVGFPDADCSYYVCEVDLFLIPRFRDLANRLWPAKIEVVQDELDLRLRQDAKNKKKKSENDDEGDND
jgi:hypothetical protein